MIIYIIFIILVTINTINSLNIGINNNMCKLRHRGGTNLPYYNKLNILSTPLTTPLHSSTGGNGGTSFKNLIQEAYRTRWGGEEEQRSSRRLERTNSTYIADLRITNNLPLLALQKTQQDGVPKRSLRWYLPIPPLPFFPHPVQELPPDIKAREPGFHEPRERDDGQ